MKKYFLTAALVLGLATCVQANEAKYTDAIDDVKKLNRGAINIVTSPLEIPKRIKHQWDKSPDHPILKGTRVIGGTAEGIIFGLGRIGSGLWDIATFNLEIPKDHEPLMSPEFVYEFDKLKEDFKNGVDK